MRQPSLPPRSNGEARLRRAGYARWAVFQSPGPSYPACVNARAGTPMHHGDVSPEVAAGLLALKKRIDAAKIPPSKLDETINVAVWNIREFGKKRRTVPALHYIAEILGQFDLIALVELRDNLEDFGRVCHSWGRAGTSSIPTGCRTPAATASAPASCTIAAPSPSTGWPPRSMRRAPRRTPEYLAGAVVLARALHVLVPRRQLRLHRHRHPYALGRQPRGPRGRTRHAGRLDRRAAEGQVGRGSRPDRDGRLQHAGTRRQDLQGADAARPAGARTRCSSSRRATSR